MDQQVAQAAETMKQWIIGGASVGSPLLPKASFDGPADRNYSLLNTSLDLYLQWEDQIGMNIGFTDKKTATVEAQVRRWFFSGPSLRYGDTFAIGNGKPPSFLRHETQPIGPDLAWSNNDGAQWQFLGGVVGQPVRTGDRVALFNTQYGHCLLEFDREVGADVGWEVSSRWIDRFGPQILSAAVALLLG